MTKGPRQCFHCIELAYYSCNGSTFGLGNNDFVRMAAVSTDGKFGCRPRLVRSVAASSTAALLPCGKTTSSAWWCSWFDSLVRATTAIPGWGLENNPAIPEIDIKVDSTAVTALTKKLKAKWSPELAQDLNAYHNLDAEVELTSILSEQIALEIDQEILNDFVAGAKGNALYWSRSPGKFVDRENGSLCFS